MGSNSGYIESNIAAIIIMTKPDEKALDRGYLVDHMIGASGKKNIKGVRALIAFDK